MLLVYFKYFVYDLQLGELFQFILGGRPFCNMIDQRKEVVVQVVGDPIEFIKMYQKACEVNGNKEQSGFSDEMLELIHTAYK